MDLYGLMDANETLAGSGSAAALYDHFKVNTGENEKQKAKAHRKNGFTDFDLNVLDQIIMWCKDIGKINFLKKFFYSINESFF